SGLSKKTYIAPSDLTLQRAVDDWLVGQRIRPNTRAAYVASLRPLVDALGAKPGQAITKNTLFRTCSMEKQNGVMERPSDI
ncbi:hypothetical protein RBA06_21895, partial [Mycobacteroides abscessus subsp. abscessus]